MLLFLLKCFLFACLSIANNSIMSTISFNVPFFSLNVFKIYLGFGLSKVAGGTVGTSLRLCLDL